MCITFKTNDMNEFLSKEFYSNTVGEWFMALLYIAGAIVFSKVIFWFFKKVLRGFTKKSKAKLDDILIDMLEEPLVFAIVVAGFKLGVAQLTLPEVVDSALGNVFTFLITVNVTWLIARVLNSLLEEYVRPLIQKTESDLDDQLYPIVKKCMSVIVWSLGIIVGLNNVGYDVGALIAGLGIGGLALAMAAQDSVSNFFGGFTIFTDKPFTLGQRVRISGYDGTVVEIGVRSFRLRTLDGTIVTIPNSTVTDSVIENVTLEPARKITLNLGLVYETTPEQIEQAIQMLKNIAEANSSVDDNYKVAFTQYGDFALGILFVYYIKKEGDILQTQTDINLEILRQFNAAGLSFAFPSQTIYMNN